MAEVGPALRGAPSANQAWPPWSPATKWNPVADGLSVTDLDHLRDRLDLNHYMGPSVSTPSSQHWRYFTPGVWIMLSMFMGLFVGFLIASRAWALREVEKTDGKIKPKGYHILQVTIRSNLSTLDLVALVWCFLPFIVPGALALWWISSPSMFPLYALSLSGFCVVLNEGIMKNWFKQPRPPQSAANSWGFPSGHVLNAYTLMVWMFLETAIPAGSVVPIHWKVVYSSLFLFFPVPWARYHNGDHSLQQVVWSSFLAGAIGVFAFVLRRLWFPFFEHPWE
eukprot:gnl/MRDRNA2_/MRDRNA2_101514_c0_seq1.p1 gnl/MRDRNA2_/MRDRNA2_101514_c0~~gnl/MRDRNA2_/MRDRNA2_101514_c0_seq1.p1  ORF type:complete len:307 (+),score=19.00 gnl/MRDRNA2_/MRDRNA2_101514_c0_seq1:83-922(+)